MMNKKALESATKAMKNGETETGGRIQDAVFKAGFAALGIFTLFIVAKDFVKPSGSPFVYARTSANELRVDDAPVINGPREAMWATVDQTGRKIIVSIKNGRGEVKAPQKDGVTYDYVVAFKDGQKVSYKGAKNLENLRTAVAAEKLADLTRLIREHFFGKKANRPANKGAQPKGEEHNNG